VEPPEAAELSSGERDRLRDEFLASPEGQEVAPDGDEAWVASLAIDFCVPRWIEQIGESEIVGAAVVERGGV